MRYLCSNDAFKFTEGKKILKNPGKKTREIKYINQKKFFSWNCIFGSFKLFPSSKIDFWPFLKLQKMEFGQKKIVKLIYLISRVFFFWPGPFLNFLCNYRFCSWLQILANLLKSFGESTCEDEDRKIFQRTASFISRLGTLYKLYYIIVKIFSL